MQSAYNTGGGSNTGRSEWQSQCPPQANPTGGQNLTATLLEDTTLQLDGLKDGWIDGVKDRLNDDIFMVWTISVIQKEALSFVL